MRLIQPKCDATDRQYPLITQITIKIVQAFERPHSERVRDSAGGALLL
jgi:hypothetical protein